MPFLSTCISFYIVTNDNWLLMINPLLLIIYAVFFPWKGYHWIKDIDIDNLLPKSNFEGLFSESTAGINHCISQGPKRKQVAIQYFEEDLCTKRSFTKVKV